MQAVATRLPADTAPRREFEGLLERARTVLAEGRDEVKGLRRAFGSSGEFWATLLRDVDLVAPDGHTRLRLAENAEVSQLPQALHHNVYAIVREAVFNALRHTQGPVSVATEKNAQHFIVSVTDRGNGLGVFRKGKPGHYGLQGMSERTAQIGGKLQLIDAEDGGTRVVLSIPCALAARDDGGLVPRSADAIV